MTRSIVGLLVPLPFLLLIATLGKAVKSKHFGAHPAQLVAENSAPILVATGNQLYCPGTQIQIVTSFSIVDPDDTGIDALYIQISSGYSPVQDQLTLQGQHPTLRSSWDVATGKLTLTGLSSQPTYNELARAVESVVFSNSSPTPSGSRTFSITVGQANYLPSNGHYYQFIPSTGITWENARTAAQNSTYYGLQGYLATITAADEAQLAGEQVSGAGWIGGSDEETEGVWKWMTGPEAGMIFWNGGPNGSTPNYAKWNNNEPNNINNEDYAHITAPGVGIPGSWNDLTLAGVASGDYQPKGYVVEYGGMPGDPVLQISTSTSLTIPQIITTSVMPLCGENTTTLTATANAGVVKWYNVPTGGVALAIGNSFTTPVLNQSTTYYVDAFESGCSNGLRTPITVPFISIPLVTTLPIVSICGENTVTLTATTTGGIVTWYSNPNGVSPLATGNSFTTPVLSQSTTFYVAAEINGCFSTSRIPIAVLFYEPPNVKDETVLLCVNSTIELDAGVSNATYLWSTGATTQTITVSTATNYSVVVTSLAPENCSKTKTFTLQEIRQPKIESIVISDTNVTLNVVEEGAYEYSIDGITFQDSNYFTVQMGGLYRGIVREKNNCGSDWLDFIMIVVPSFFTPNGDGYNDTFEIKGLAFYPKASLSIFNRFGKLLKQLNATDYLWDGTLNGQKLPSDDYWFVLEIDGSAPLKKGHFSLIR